MNVSKTVSIDLNRPRRNVVHLDQGDNTREIHLVLLCDGVPYNPEDGLTGVTKSVKYIASNGASDENSGGVTAVSGKDNEYTVKLNHGETNVPGFTEVFVVFSKSGNILHTFPIMLDVIQTETDISPSAPILGAYLRKDAQTAKTSAMTQRVGVDADGQLWVKPGEGGGGGSDDAVLYVEQSLTSEEQAQARTNIGAGTYSKPSGGITIYDLGQAEQQSLYKAETAIQPQSDMKNLGGGIAQSTTSGGTVPKTAAMTGYKLTVNGIVAVRFTTPVEASATLDINSTGAKPIYYHGAAVTSGIISYGDTATFAYDGTNYNLLSLDTARPNINHGSANSGLPLVVGSDGNPSVGSWPTGPNTVTVTGNTPSITPVDNTVYDCTGTEITSLTVSSYSYGVSFTLNFDIQPTTSPTITLDSKISLPPGFTFEANRNYEINVDGKGRAVVGAWELVS